MKWLKDWLAAAGLGTLVGLAVVVGWLPATPVGRPLQPAQRTGVQPCADPMPRLTAGAGPWSTP